MSWLKPIVFENNPIPVWLSKLAPIEINALSFGPFVICRGKLSEETRRHETIHFHQQLEMLFVFQWVLYGLFYIIGRFTTGSWKMSYYHNPFEMEAYAHQSEKDYLKRRKLWAWTKYLKTLKAE